MVVSRASATVAEACQQQVGHVKGALAEACNAELGQLKALLADACNAETAKLHRVLASACDEELQRVAGSLAVACAQEVEAVRLSCQEEISRVKDALRTACQLEVDAVKEQCQQEVAQVRLSLQKACQYEVSQVKAACQQEVQKVKESLADACQQEVASMAALMAGDVERVRSEQRKQLQQAAEPYLLAVQKVQLHTVARVEQLHDALEHEQARTAAAEAEVQKYSFTVRGMQHVATDRERRAEADVRLRAGGRFLLVHRPTLSPEGALGVLASGPLGALLRGGAPAARAPWQVGARAVRLSKAGDALLVTAAGGEAEPEQWDLSEFESVQLGASRHAVTFAAGSMAARPADGGKKGRADRSLDGAPAWHFVTLQRHEGPRVFLLADSSEVAMLWVYALAPRLAGYEALATSSYAGLLWRRVRLRLDRLAVQQRSTRLGVLANMLRVMATEEEARIAWVRYHLKHGQTEAAERLGWSPTENGTGGTMGMAASKPPLLALN